MSTSERMALQIDTPIQFVKGVGPKFGSILEKRGIHTVHDLLTQYPRGYEDRRAVRFIANLAPQQVVSLRAKIQSVRSFRLGKSHKKIWDVTLSDSSGRISAKFFRVPYRGYFERLQPHQTVRVAGRVISYKGRLEFHHPDLHPIGDEDETQDELLPLYSESEGLTPSRLRNLIQTALGDGKESLDIPDPLPASILERYQLIGRAQALREIHKPPLHEAELFECFRSSAQRRLIFDEFFQLELVLAQKKSLAQQITRKKLVASGDWVQRVKAQLPFQLTEGQSQALAETLEDLKRPRPMQRLIQGDVGSGKTVVALLAAVWACEAGAQVALMAPTEILAEQHYHSAQRLLGSSGLRIGLLVGAMKAQEREEGLRALRSGETQICIGTQALIQESVEFSNLGLVIVDEQHRFGVEQRQILKQKGDLPHFLVMTATPIPRTLAMTVYGDLDISLIRERPKNRMSVVTRKVFESQRDKMMAFVRGQLQKGRQAYFVYPLVEETESAGEALKNATDECGRIRKELSPYRVDLLHGQMKSAEKDEVMERFRRAETQVLVATTVIEVGVDVPNATVMVVEHAERFGLSQLHQLRGRVGRGHEKSFCFLMQGYAQSQEALRRSEIMESTDDGFKIAEYDLEMRGPGEFLGVRQSGLAGFKLANLVRDAEILSLARQAAFDIIRQDPQLLRPEYQLLKGGLHRQLALWVG